MTCVAFSIKFAKSNQKFAGNSEFCENYSLLFKIIHWCPYWGLPGQSRCVALDRVFDDARDAAGIRAFDRLPRPSLSAPEKTDIAKGTKTAEAF